jgi:protein ImuB
MSHWMALLPGTAPLRATEAVATEAPSSAPVPPPALDALHLGWWALQFTPRVAVLADAVVLEVAASERLFGGTDALHERIAHEARAWGAVAHARAGTALAALALAQPHSADAPAAPDARDDAARLDALPLQRLPGVADHAATLSRLGCRTLADVRALPRGGLSRRFGADLLRSLDQAYGLRAEVFEWLTLPPVFDAWLELPGRVDAAPALHAAAHHLLQQMCAWLAGHRAGVATFTLHWRHDWRNSEGERHGTWTVRLSQASRDLTRLSRLLAEHLQRLVLTAPVSDVGLHAEAIEPLPDDALSLFPSHLQAHRPDAPVHLDPAAWRAQCDALLALLDRLSVRLGAERVQQGEVQADHRLECAQRWRAAVHNSAPTPASSPQAALPCLPQPSWVLASPMPLPLSPCAPTRELPLYQGPLTLLAGPHRVEAGWWDPDTRQQRVTRDYYLASSAQAGLLWVFKTRTPAQAHVPGHSQGQGDAAHPGSPWFLHGFFA